MMTEAQITVGDLSAFLLYAAYVGVSFGGKALQQIKYSVEFKYIVCSSVVRAFAHGAVGPRIDLSWGGPIKLFLVPASAPRLV